MFIKEYSLRVTSDGPGYINSIYNQKEVYYRSLDAPLDFTDYIDQKRKLNTRLLAINILGINLILRYP